MSDDDKTQAPDEQDTGEGTDQDNLPGAPGDSDTELGDTDQHSDADA